MSASIAPVFFYLDLFWTFRGFGQGSYLSVYDGVIPTVFSNWVGLCNTHFNFLPRLKRSNPLFILSHFDSSRLYIKRNRVMYTCFFSFPSLKIPSFLGFSHVKSLSFFRLENSEAAADADNCLFYPSFFSGNRETFF